MVYPSTGLTSQNALCSSVLHLSEKIAFTCTELGFCIDLLVQNAIHPFRGTAFKNGINYSVNNISISCSKYLEQHTTLCEFMSTQNWSASVYQTGPLTTFPEHVLSATSNQDYISLSSKSRVSVYQSRKASSSK